MLPGIGGSELIVIAVVALIVIGPKDLPKLLRQLGRFVGKMRNMADDFRSAFDDMARQSELDDLRKEVEALRQNQPLDSVGHQMKAISSDIQTGLNAASSRPAYATPPAEVVDVTSGSTPDEELDPQLQGLPPKWTPADLANGEAPPAIMPETTTTPPEVVIKKAPRVRKAATEATVAPAKKARARKAEKPKIEKTVS